MNAQDITLPLDYYRATQQQRITLATANDLLIRDCMRRYGFDWPVQARPMELIPDRRYGISNRAEVTNYGYHLPPERSGGSQPKPGTFQTPSAAEQAVFNGMGPSRYQGKQIPQGGCNGEAARSFGLKDVSDSFVDSGSLVQMLDREANDSYRTDTRTLDLWAKWSACMARSGYRYRTPADAADDTAWGTETATKKEITTALADLACREEFNVAGVSLAIETAYQKRLIERNAEALREGKAKLDTRITQAIAIAGGGR